MKRDGHIVQVFGDARIGIMRLGESQVGVHLGIRVDEFVGWRIGHVAYLHLHGTPFRDVFPDEDSLFHSFIYFRFALHVKNTIGYAKIRKKILLLQERKEKKRLWQPPLSLRANM